MSYLVACFRSPGVFDTPANGSLSLGVKVDSREHHGAGRIANLVQFKRKQRLI